MSVFLSPAYYNFRHASEEFHSSLRRMLDSRSHLVTCCGEYAGPAVPLTCKKGLECCKHSRPCFIWEGPSWSVRVGVPFKPWCLIVSVSTDNPAFDRFFPVSSSGTADSPQVKFILSCINAMRRDADLSKHLHRDHHRVTRPRSVGRPEYKKEGTICEFSGLWIEDGEVSYLCFHSNLPPPPA